MAIPLWSSSFAFGAALICGLGCFGAGPDADGGSPTNAPESSPVDAEANDPIEDELGIGGRVWCFEGGCEHDPADLSCAVCVIEPECDCPGDKCTWIADLDGDGIFAQVGLLAFRDHADSILTVCSSLSLVDCDDGDPFRARLGYIDRDGDGYVSGSICSYPGETDVIFQAKGRDCDDTDPNRYIAGYIDRDGDGVTAEYVCMGLGDPVRGPSTGNDCDDEDPEKKGLQYPDEDADGWGDSGRSTCEPPREGLIGRGGDCDDSDPARPSLLEVWGDELDSDCDGSDGTVGIQSTSCGEEKFPFPMETCEGVNLILEEFCTPENCSSTRVLRVGNNGTEFFAGSFTLEHPSSVVLEMEIELAPGDTTPPFTLHGSAWFEELRLHAPGVEGCDPLLKSLPPINCNIP